MLFFHPGAQYRFEIPDAWLQEAGVLRFTPRAPCYQAEPDPQWPALAVGILQVSQPPHAHASPVFDEARMVTVLKAMARGQALPALWCATDATSGRLVLCEGLHRYHAAVALRFRQVPVSLRPQFRL